MARFNFFKSLLSTAAVLLLCVNSSGAFADSKQINPHYELVMSENDALCKPVTSLYNELLVDPIKECTKHGLPTKCEYRATNFEERKPEKFAKIGLIEPPIKEIELPSPPHNIPATYKEHVYLVDFFNEGKPRIVTGNGQMSDGGRTESTQVIVLKKDAKYNADIDNPKFIEFTTPKKYMTTARVFMSSGQPYIIVNHYTFVSARGGEKSEVTVSKLTTDGLENVCRISLEDQNN